MDQFKIDAKFKDKILVPYAAIENNIEFATCSWRDNIVIYTNDGRKGKLKYHKEVHILSQDGMNLLAEIYPSLTLEQFLSMWYSRTKGRMRTLDFQYIELNELDNTTTVPATAD